MKNSPSEKNLNKYRELKQTSQRLCRKAHQNYVNDLISEDKNNKKLFSYIRSKRTENVGISDLCDGINVIQDPLIKANMFNEQFSSVFSTPGTPLPRTVQSSFPPMPNIIVSIKGVLRLMLDIKENKATGPDGIPGKLLKTCAHELADSFTLLFQKSLDNGVIPDEWKKAKISPVFKKGDKGKAENYRPISLTSIPCKLLEHIVCSSIMSHLDRFKILNDAQHGFRKNRSCETQLITTLRDFSTSLNDKSQTDAIFLDFSKAFDKVDHQILLSKLHGYGINPTLVTWAESFLLGRTQSVIVDGTESSPLPVLSGVPQGTVLGPLFFLVYINDITKNISPGTTVRLFADDTSVYRRINSEADAIELQNDLDILQEWEVANKMEFHPGKCQLLRVTNKRKPIAADYSIHSQNISKTDSVKYLGVTIDSKLAWSDHYNKISAKANSTLAFLRRNTYACPKPVKETCYNAFVRPTVEYSSCVWDPHQQNNIQQLEKIQKRAARYVTGNHALIEGNTAINMTTLGWVPLEERRARSKLLLLFKARTGDIDIPIDDLILSSRANRNSLHSNYLVPYSSVNSHLYSFFPSTIRLWNALPQSAKASANIDLLKGQLNLLKIRSAYTPSQCQFP